jgi:AraC-like DNA-binding protein
MTDSSRSLDDLGSFAFKTAEPEELAARGEALAWKAEYVATQPGFQAEVAVARARASQVVRIDFRSPTIAVGEPPENHFIFSIPLRIREPVRFGGERMDRSSVGIFWPSSEYQFCTTGAAAFILIAVDQERLDALASSRSALGQLIEAGSPVWQVRDFELIRSLAARLSARMESAIARPAAWQDDPVARMLETRLSAALIEGLESQKRRPPLRHAAARRAASYLRSHWAQPIRLRDIRTAAGVSERGLRAGFEDVYGCSPTTYLRFLRHHAVRSRLRREGGRVGDIALACGFRNLGDFSIEYRKIFGETPSSTRRAARSV